MARLRFHVLVGVFLITLAPATFACDTVMSTRDRSEALQRQRDARPPRYVALAAQAAAQTRVDVELVLAVMAVESQFQPNAVSPKSAKGLMQLTDGTARRFGVRDVFDPAQNIRGGVLYLAWLLDFFDGNLALVLAGYNAGEQAVVRYGGVPPFAETRAYVAKIRASLTDEAIGIARFGRSSGTKPPDLPPHPVHRVNLVEVARPALRAAPIF